MQIKIDTDLQIIEIEPGFAFEAFSLDAIQGAKFQISAWEQHSRWLPGFEDIQAVEQISIQPESVVIFYG